MERAAAAPGRSSWLATFWIAQAVPLYLGAVLMAASKRGPSAWAEKAVDPAVLAWAAVTILVVTVLQAVFHLPVPPPKAVRGPGVSMGIRLAVVGALVAILVAAAAATIVDGVTALRGEMGEPDGRWGIAAGVLGAAWLVATPLLFRFVRGRDPSSFLSRLASRMLVGTAVEVAASIPVAVLVSRRSRCYCGEVSIFALVLIVALGVLVMGPAVLIPVLAKRRRSRLGQSAPS